MAKQYRIVSTNTYGNKPMPKDFYSEEIEELETEFRKRLASGLRYSNAVETRIEILNEEKDRWENVYDEDNFEEDHENASI